MIHARHVIIYVFASFFIYSCARLPQRSENLAQVRLPNGWFLSPAGRSLQLGDLPLNMQLSPSNTLLAVTNNGQSKHVVQLIDVKTEKLVDEQVIAKAWYGLKFTSDSKKLLVSGGNDNIILVYPVESNRLGRADTIRLGERWPKEKISPTGLDIDNGAGTLYVVTKENNSLYVVDIQTGKIRNKISVGHEAYSCILSPDMATLYISLWGGDKVLLYDTKTSKIISSIATDNHPNELLLSRSGQFLYVANANSNSVSVIDTKQKKVIETIVTSLYSTQLTGSTTNGLALSADEGTLYIANADNNCLAVFDVSVPGRSSSLGFIPTGWYPTNVKVAHGKIFVANGKGFSSLPNPYGPQPVKIDDSGPHMGTQKRDVQYIGGLFKGTMSIIDEPHAERLRSYTRQVYANSPFTATSHQIALGETGNPVPFKAGQKSPLKYVFYVIKENRTYDQVLGDMKEGNGDSSLCIFPERISPNHHALAREFVLLDNFYVNAEVSADGHDWSTAAYATDFTEKTWPTSYGGRGGSYDYEGGRKITHPKDGFIWDYCKRAGVTYRSYGEFADNGNASIDALKGHACRGYSSFGQHIRDVDRFKVWKRDFDSLLAISAVPQFNTIRFPNDHTSGQRIGSITPTAAVADNDLALGQFIEYISNSPIWKETAIFVLEDDAQNGPDHVDAHRSPAFVISPYTKRGVVNSNMYSTSGMLRTMELILGLPPMSQYDAAALPMFACFTSTPNFTPYKARPANVNLEERNVAWNKSAERSENWSFVKEDSAPDIDLNEVVWKSVKGEHSEMPAPRRSAFVILEKKKDKD